MKLQPVVVSLLDTDLYKFREEQNEHTSSNK